MTVGFRSGYYSREEELCRILCEEGVEAGRDAGEDYSGIVQGIFGDPRSDADVADLVVRRGWAGRERVDEALRAREMLGQPLAQVLLKLGIITLDQFTELLSGPNGEDEPRLGGTLGRYTLRRVIGRGGMATVFEADDPVLQRRVALKVIPEGDVDEEVVRRLHREAAVMAQLRHPNIVGVHEAGIVASGALRFHYLAMDYIPGRTMAEVIADPKVDRETKLRMLEDVARAVAHAHGHGILHRDLKPSNVLVNAEGQVLLTDFGLARAEKFRTRLTRSMEVLGTPAYMAPEQISGRTREIDERSDVYALGVMLYEILTGKIPFEASSSEEIYFKIVGTEPDRPRRHRPGLERELEVICLKAIEKDPKRRYVGAAGFAEDLRRFRAGEPILAKPPSVSYRVRKWMRRQRRILMLAAAVLVSSSIVWLAVAGAMGEKSRRAEEDRRRKGAALAEIEKSRMALEKARAYLHWRELKREEFVRCAEEAAEHARSAERIAPGLAAGPYHLAQAEDLLGDWDQAETDCRRAIALEPSFAPARALLGRLLLDRVFEIRHAPEREWPGVERRQAALLAEAAPHLRAAVEGGRDWEGPLQRAAAEYDLAVAERRGSDASALLRANVQVYAAQPGWEHFLVRDASRCGDPPHEMEALDVALRIRPSFYLALIRRGHLLVQSREPGRALADLNRAVAIHPQHGTAYFLRSAAHLANGDKTAAIEDLSEAIRLGLDQPDLHYNCGSLRREVGEPDAALRDLTRAIELDGTFAAAYNNRGLALRDLGRLDEAIQDYGKAIALDPRMVTAYLNRALLREKTGDRRGAAEDAREALKRELTPAQREAMGDLLRRLGEKP